MSDDRGERYHSLMSNEHDTRLDQVNDRLTSLEMHFLHLERTVEALNSVVLEQQQRIERIEAQFARFLEREERLSPTGEDEAQAEG